MFYAMLHLYRFFSFAFYGFCKSDQFVGRFIVLIVAVQQYILAKLAQCGFYFIIDNQLAGIYNAISIPALMA